MKKILIPAVVLAAMSFASCGGGWSDDDKKKFTDMCNDKIGGMLGEEEAKKACDCTLEKLQKEYSSYADADKSGNQDKIAEMMKECLTAPAEGDKKEE